MENNMRDLINTISAKLSYGDVLAAEQLAKISTMILKARIDKGMTQKEFAHLLGVSQSMVSKWESEDYNFTVEALANICDKLDWDLNICMRPRSKNAFYQIGKGTRNNWVTKDNPTNNPIWMGVAS